MHDLYREVTDQIVAELKTGVRPLIKPWSETPGLNIPANAVTISVLRLRSSPMSASPI